MECLDRVQIHFPMRLDFDYANGPWKVLGNSVSFKCPKWAHSDRQSCLMTNAMQRLATRLEAHSWLNYSSVASGLGLAGFCASFCSLLIHHHPMLAEIVFLFVTVKVGKEIPYNTKMFEIELNESGSLIEFPQVKFFWYGQSCLKMALCVILFIFRSSQPFWFGIYRKYPTNRFRNFPSIWSA